MPGDNLQRQGKVGRAAVGKRKRPPDELSSSSSSDEEFVPQQPPPPIRKRKAKSQQQRQQQQRQQQEEKVGDYTLKYQDDKTGSRPVHPTALRFTLGIAEDLARDTATSVAKSLKEDGELEESRKVQVYTPHHVKTIVSRVREKLREAKIPTFYVRIEDLNLHELAGINQTRREDIATNEKLIKKLEQQVEVLKKEGQDAKTKMDEAQTKLNAKMREEQRRNEGAGVAIHPLLQSITQNSGDDLNNARTATENGAEGTESNVAPSIGCTLADLFKAIPSPYDD